jgi:hypothetical protein
MLDFIRDLESKGVVLNVEGSELIVTGRLDLLTEPMRDRIRADKVQLIEAVSRAGSRTCDRPRDRPRDHARARVAFDMPENPSHGATSTAWLLTSEGEENRPLVVRAIARAIDTFRQFGSLLTEDAFDAWCEVLRTDFAQLDLDDRASIGFRALAAATCLEDLLVREHARSSFDLMEVAWNEYLDASKGSG